MKKKLSNKQLIKEKRGNLHYWQMQVRMQTRWLRGCRDKCKQIAKEMRELQKEIESEKK